MAQTIPHESIGYVVNFETDNIVAQRNGSYTKSQFRELKVTSMSFLEPPVLLRISEEIDNPFRLFGRALSNRLG